MKNNYHSTYTHPITERAIRTLYSWGTVNKCVEIYESGATTREVEAQTGVPNYTVWDWMNKLGISRPFGYQFRLVKMRGSDIEDPADFDREVAFMRTQECRTIEEIAAALNVSRNRICASLERTGVRRRKKYANRKAAETLKSRLAGRGMKKDEFAAFRRAEVAKMPDARPQDLARMFNVSVATIYLDRKNA